LGESKDRPSTSKNKVKKKEREERERRKKRKGKKYYGILPLVDHKSTHG
jgi:hypothetical protein